MKIQQAIINNSKPHGRFLVFNLKECKHADLKLLLKSLSIDEAIIIGFGKKLLEKLAMEVEDYHEFPVIKGLVSLEVTHGDLFVFVRDDEPGIVAIRALQIKHKLTKFFEIRRQVNGFKYLGEQDGYGHDLTGYEDGTENPLADEAVKAVVREDGSTFVALQQWQHDLIKFDSYSQEEKDAIIGRRLSDNSELSDGPATSHVNRTDQGTFDIDATILRRSMPWSNEHGEGLMFMSFCENLERFEVQMRRMVGQEDGLVDSLFRFSKVVNSAYFYCPAVEKKQLVIP